MENYQDKAFSVIKSRRLTAERNHEIFMAKLRKDEEFASLENACDTLHFRIAEKEAFNKDLGNLNEEYEALKAKFEEKLKSLNLTRDDLLPKYFCPLCKDTGEVGRELCKCVRQLAFEGMQRDSDALPRNLPVSFEGIDYSIYGEGASQGYKKLFAFLDGIAGAFPSLRYDVIYLHGAVGTGKTFAAGVLANTLIGKGCTVLFINAQQLTSLFLKYHSARVSDKYGIFEPLVEADLLVIDDLGSEPLFNNVSEPYLLEVIAERMGKLTVFTSNLTIKDVVSRYGQRIGSRLADTSKVFAINISGDDLRLKR